MTSWPLLGMAIGIGFMVASAHSDKRPILIWNASPSLPVGLYRVARTTPQLRDAVLLRLPPSVAALAARRGYLAHSAYLLKPVVAAAGDRVCRLGVHIWLRGRLAARAKLRDRLGRAMPSWHGCNRLQTDELFLLAEDPQSFDSRYFGAVSGSTVVGREVLLWTSR